MDGSEAPKDSLRTQDVQALIGILAVIEGSLRGGALDALTVDGLGRRLVREGLLETDPAYGHPSAGRVAVAMANLNQRLRFSVGEYDSEPEPEPEATTFTILFATQAQAKECGAELVDAIALFLDQAEDGWWLHAVYPELAPDEAFWSRESELQRTAQRFEGRARGTQTPPRR